MQKLLNIMTIWLLSIAAFCSCTNIEQTTETGNVYKTVIINGTVSEISSRQPIEGVKIAFMAYGKSGRTDEPVSSINAYTDSRGTFNLKAEEIGTAVKCILTTEHPGYSGVEKEIIINWTGPSYDPESKIFYVNDCDFHLARK
jgi:hypothetical protein